MRGAAVAALATVVVCACERDATDASVARTIVDLPSISRGGAPLTGGAVLRLTSTELQLDGRHIAVRSQPEIWITLNVVAPVAPVTNAIKNMTPTPSALTVEVDRETPYTVLASLIWASVRAGVKDVRIAAVERGHKVALPLWQRSYPEAPRGQLPVRPELRITRDALVLYSMSGLEGESYDPLVTLTRDSDGLTELTRNLEAVALRHYRGQPAPSDEVVLLIPMTNVAMQDLVDVVAAVAMSQDGRALFPSIALTVVK